MTELKKVERRLLGKNFFFFTRKQFADSAKQAGGFNGREEKLKQQQRMAIMKDLIEEKSRSKGSMDAKSRWWVAKLLAKDCQKAWTHPVWEDTMQKWYEWLEYMKKKDEKEKWRRCISERFEKMIKSAEGSGALLHKITKPTMWRGGVQILKEEEEDARLLDRCEARSL